MISDWAQNNTATSVLEVHLYSCGLGIASAKTSRITVNLDISTWHARNARAPETYYKRYPVMRANHRNLRTGRIAQQLTFQMHSRISVALELLEQKYCGFTANMNISTWRARNAHAPGAYHKRYSVVRATHRSLGTGGIALSLILQRHVRISVALRLLEQNNCGFTVNKNISTWHARNAHAPEAY